MSDRAPGPPDGRSQRARELTSQFNNSEPADPQAGLGLLRELLGSVGEGTEIRPPLYCDYGYRPMSGRARSSTSGWSCWTWPPAGSATTCRSAPTSSSSRRPTRWNPRLRRAKWEAAQPITVADNVWLGGGVIVCPGVGIGENTVVGAGAVVIKDLPANVLAVGNPARVVRSL